MATSEPTSSTSGPASDDLAPAPADQAALSRREFVTGAVALGATLAGADALRADALRAAQSPASAGAPTPRVPGPSVANRAPLVPTPFQALPLGSVRARGWLLTQLQLQAEGLTGHAEQLLPAAGANSAWRGGKGEDWEKGPYYLKGLLPLAYTLDDATLKLRAQNWIEPILASQREDGFFGPTTNEDWWPRMVATYLLRDYAEATNDARVAPFLSRYYRHMSDHLPARPLRDWGRARAGDEIDTVLWLYNRSGEDFLLKLADLLHEQAYQWTEIYSENQFGALGWMEQHNVNVPQALKMPAVYYQRSGAARDREALAKGVANLNRDHGTAFGINTGSEKLAGRSPSEGVETCSIVEKMLSEETALRILGDPALGDSIEMLAFNALPAALSSDIHQHVYYTIANHVKAPLGHFGFADDHGDDVTPAPRSGFPCCCYNLHMGWPKLAQNSWAATADGGLALLVNLPSQVAALIGGQTVTVDCQTNYPFEETLNLTVSLASPARFPLKLRVPAWCEGASLKVNGRAQPQPRAGEFAVIERQWREGDRVEMRLPMRVTTQSGALETVSVQRGPLVFALAIDEDWQRIDDPKREGAPGFESYQVMPKSPWNWALEVDETDPTRSFALAPRAMPANPFATGTAPLALRARARRVSNWTLRPDAIGAFDPPVNPLLEARAQTVTLAPFGSQMLRVTNFPVARAASASAQTWQPVSDGTGAQMLSLKRLSGAAPRAWEADFEGAHLDGWIFYGGNWYLRDGLMRLPTQTGAAHTVAPAARFGDFVLDAQLAPTRDGDVGLSFRVRNAALKTDEYQGYYLGLRAADNQVVLGRSDFAWVPLQSAPLTLEAGQLYHLRIEARGPQIRVWVAPNALDANAKPTLEIRDDRYADGAIGVRCYGANEGKANAGVAQISVRAL